MKSCWKFDLWTQNRTCTTENYYYYDRFTGKQAFEKHMQKCLQFYPHNLDLRCRGQFRSHRFLRQRARHNSGGRQAFWLNITRDI